MLYEVGMSKPGTYKATQGDWDLQKAWSDECQDARCLLELRARVEALEAGATCPHIVTSGEGTSYCGLAEQTARIGQSDVPADTSAQTSQSTPNDRQIRSSLVGEVARAISLDAWDDAGNWTAEARAAIRAVAKWFKDNERGYNAVAWLEQELER
jgi:hypothetical protein